MHKKTNLFLGGLVGSTVVAGMALASSGAGAARWTDATASVTVESTCSMTATIAQGDEHTATLVNGTYSSGSYPNGIGKTRIQTFCNDQGGYAIYAIGYTNDELGNNKMEGAGLSSSYDIVTGTATSAGAQDVSNWAMKVTAVASDNNNLYTPSIMNGFSSFSAVPSTYTKVAKLDKATDSPSGTNLGSTIETTYAAYISNTQPAGTYTGQVKYALVHPNASAAPNAYVMQEIADWKDELLPGIQYNAVDNRDGKSYTVALMSVDTDGDGNDDYDEVWMTQNLDLCIGCTGVSALTSENTDLRQYNANGTTFTDYTYDGTKIIWSPTAANSNSTLTGSPKTITFPATGTTGSLNADWGNNNNAPRMAEGADTIMYKGGTRYVTTTENDVVTTALQKCEAAGHSEADCLHYQVGNYYNWSAAVAMSSTSSYTAKSTVMPNSICPAGWRLPDGPVGNNTISDFNTLLNVYNIANGNDYGTGDSSINVGFKTDGLNKIESAPLYFARSGYVNGSALYNFSSYGLYWSSTVLSSGGAYYLYYDSGVLYPAYRSSRVSGWSVRCMAR